MEAPVILSRERGATDRLLAALRGPNPAAVTEHELIVAGTPISEDLVSCDWGREDAGRPGVVFRATLEWSPSMDLGREDVILNLLIDGVRVRSFTGKVHRFSAGGDAEANELIAHTGGYWLDKISMKTDEDYDGERPEDVVRDAVLRNRFYDSRFIFVERAGSNLLFGRRGARRFKAWADKLDRPLDAVGREAKYRYIDNVLGGLDARVKKSPAIAGEVVWSYVVGEDFDGFLPEPLGDEYSEVVALREVDGDLVPLEGMPIPVPGSKAPPDTPYEIPISDDGGDEGAGVLYDEEIWQQANLAASRFALGEASCNFSVDWINPLVFDGSNVAVAQPFSVGSGADKISGVRHWIAEVGVGRCRIGSEGESKTQEFQTTMVRAREDVAPRPKVRPIGAYR